jgi:predicted RNA-binding Zn-ribbon protein involved in translation (DUF1610 family)
MVFNSEDFSREKLAKRQDPRYCLDCERVFSSEQAIEGRCPWCGSGASHLISRWIDREEVAMESII